MKGKTGMKKSVSLILVAAMLLAMLPVFAASAASGASVQPLPVTGDKVVIYNDYGESIFGAQSSDKVKAVTSTTNADGTIHFGNGGYIFTVTVSGGYYTFESKGKYLACSTETDSSGNSKEIICYYTQQSDYTKWRLQSTTGGYIMYNKTAKYNGNSVVIEFYSGGFTGWTNYGSPEQFAMNFYKVEDPYNLGFVLNPKVNISANDAFIGMDYEFSFELDDMTSLSSLKVEYSVGAGYQTILPTTVTSRNYKVTIAKELLAGKSELMLWVTAKNTYGIEYNGSAAVQIHDEPLILSVSPLPNAAATGKRPEISAAISNCGTNPKVTMTLDGAAVTPTVTASRISYTPAADLTDGSHTAALKIVRSDNRKTEMTWTFFVNRAALTPYFGQVHSHTTYSDGAGSLASAYEHAMTVKDLDFLIVTDHSNYFDTSSSATTTSYYNLSSLIKSGSISKWEEAKKTAAEYNAKSSDFICAYGYEMTWSGGPGHTNTFNTFGVVSRNNSELNNKSNYAGMYRYNDLMVNANAGLDVNGKPVTGSTRTKYIADAPVISQMNHPGTTFGTFDDYAGRTDARDEIINLIEVGNGSGAVLNSSYWRSYSEYDKALAKGWHIAPTNNQDNHSGRWGSSNTHRTVVLTDDFTEAGLYRAMAQRRVYATEDQNLRIFYYLNNQVMGSIVNAGKSVDIAVSLSDPDGEKLGKVEIIGENGKSLKSYTVAGSTYELKDTIANTDAYYYIKVTETDGDIAVTAPVWIGGEEQGCTTHSWNSGTITQTATCTESGIKTYTCTVCGATKTQKIKALGHNWDAGTVTTQPSYTSEGVKTFTCLRCGDTKTESIAPLTHTHSYTAVVTAPTCTQQGYTTHTCTICGDSYQDSKTEALGHAWDSGEITLQPGCTATGIKTFTCTRPDCGATRNVMIVALGHSYNAAVTAPTCTEKGYTTHTCSRCNDSYRDSVVNALGHAWDAGTVTTQPTCTVKGVKTFTCTRCSVTKTEEVAALGHHFVDGVCTQCGENDPNYDPDKPVKPCNGGKDCPSYSFGDVNYGDWYHEAVDFAVTNNLFKGMTATTFEPNTPMTRGMLVTVLWRYNGQPKEGGNFFADVKDGQWYTDAIAWASHNGIVGGVGNGRFDPDGKVTREQLAAILYRYSGADGAWRGSYASYPDADSVSSWAADAYAWAIGEGLISGNLINGKTMLDPQGSATRAQVAIILMRYIQNQ